MNVKTNTFRPLGSISLLLLLTALSGCVVTPTDRVVTRPPAQRPYPVVVAADPARDRYEEQARARHEREAYMARERERREYERDRRKYERERERERERYEREAYRGRHDDRRYDDRRVEVRIGGYFQDSHRREAYRYYHEHESRGFCPPGLAKKNNGCMPPGQARRWVVGQPLPRDAVRYRVEPEVRVQLGTPPAGHEFVRVASDILLIAVGTSLVIDAIEDLGR